MRIIAEASLSKSESKLVESLLGAYENHQAQISLFRDQLLVALASSKPLSILVHSLRSRIKESSHVRDKLLRKILRCRKEGSSFDITSENLLISINDLVGIRILHLYTRQFEKIDSHLRSIFDENKYDLIEGPFARTWDDESRQYFKGCGIQTQESPSMYTSVHYVIGSASRTRVTAEIQVRTLMEEVWGEVNHMINYPLETGSLACREQLKVLARVTSSATRLVDSIFMTVEDHDRAPGRTGGQSDFVTPSKKVATARSKVRRKR